MHNVLQGTCDVYEMLSQGKYGIFFLVLLLSSTIHMDLNLSWTEISMYLKL